MANEVHDTLPEETLPNPGADVEMVEGGGADGENMNGGELPFADTDIVEPRTSFASYLMSPVVTLLIGSGDQSILTAHQALLTQSPYFEEACSSFVDDGSVGTQSYLRCSIRKLIPREASSNPSHRLRPRCRRLLPRVPLHGRVLP